MREVIVVLWSIIVYNIFIDTDVATTGVSIGQGGSTICTDVTIYIETGFSTF